MSDLVPVTPTAGASVTPAHDVHADLQRFERVIQVQLEQVGLPTGELFVDVAQRQVMLGNMPAVLAALPPDVLGRSYYISKMIAAAAVGLFDAALNYLWDELVSELRRRVAGFDLAYFYDVAAGGSDLRKHLKGEDDLVRLDDAHLLRAARDIGLLTDMGFTRLDHIRYMRNHASAAHPNQVELTGLDLAQWLQVCITQVITTPPNNITATTGRLLANLKKDRLDDGALRDAAVFFDQLPGDRADTLGDGLFGLYVDPSRTPSTADNIRRLWPGLWPFISEDNRLAYGLRCARAGASLDRGAATAARELLDIVDAASYLPEDLRAGEIDAVLDTLIAAHHGHDNFYNEAAPARQLEALVGAQGSVPAAVARKYTRTVVEVFLGNGHGVPWAAVSIYRNLLERLDTAEAGRALRAFTDPAIASLLFSSVARRQWAELLDILEPKLTRRRDRDLMSAVRAFPGTPDELAGNSGIQTLIKPVARP